MSFTILYTKSAKKDIDTLDIIAKNKIKKKFELLKKDPILYARKLSNTKIGSYQWRVGNHRIIFDIIRKKIIVLRMGHRKDVYR